MRREGTIQALMKLRGLAIRKIEAIPVAIPLIRPLKWARGPGHAPRYSPTSNPVMRQAAPLLTKHARYSSGLRTCSSGT